MEGLELICFEIISSVGMARSLYIEAIQEAKAGNFEQAQELIKQGDESFTEGHHSHAKLIQQEAGGEATQMTLLLTHAEDQLMSAEAFKILSQEFMDLYKEIKSIKIGKQEVNRMIYISCGLNQEFIIDLLEKTTEEGVSFKYEGKRESSLHFT